MAWVFEDEQTETEQQVDQPTDIEKGWVFEDQQTEAAPDSSGVMGALSSPEQLKEMQAYR